MFYCESCRKKKGWPQSWVSSYGNCEICDVAGMCNDLPSSQLPSPPASEVAPADMNNNPVRMTRPLEHAQFQVRKFFMDHPHPKSPQASLGYCVEELGEVAGEMRKRHLSGNVYDLHPDLVSEMGDLIFSVLDLTDQLGLNAQDCFQLAIEKYERRIKTTGSMGNNKN